MPRRLVRSCTKAAAPVGRPESSWSSAASTSAGTGRPSARPRIRSVWTVPTSPRSSRARWPSASPLSERWLSSCTGRPTSSSGGRSTRRQNASLTSVSTPCRSTKVCGIADRSKRPRNRASSGADAWPRSRQKAVISEAIPSKRPVTTHASRSRSLAPSEAAHSWSKSPEAVPQRARSSARAAASASASDAPRVCSRRPRSCERSSPSRPHSASFTTTRSPLGRTTATGSVEPPTGPPADPSRASSGVMTRLPLDRRPERHRRGFGLYPRGVPQMG